MKYIYLLLFQLISLCGFAQTGSIRGKVSDAEAAKPLVGAQILLEQNGQQLRSVQTDLDGNFVLLSVPAGVYRLVCTHAEAPKQEIKGMTIREGGIRLAYFRLGNPDIDLGGKAEEKQESDRLNRYSAQSMLLRRKSSQQIIETLAAESVFHSGDEDLSKALRQLPQINVENNNQLSIRGLGGRYVKTLLNGAELPSLDLNSSSSLIQLDLFPTTIIDHIILRKGYSVDQLASFGTGIINIETRRFPDQQQFQAQLHVGMHERSSFNADFQTYEGGSLDFLGIDDGSRSLPSQALNLGDNSSARDLTLALRNRSLQVADNFSSQSWMPGPNLGFNLSRSRRQDLKKGRSLSYAFVALFKRSSMMYEGGYASMHHLIGDYDSSYELENQLELSDRFYAEQTRANLFFTLSYKSRRNRVSLVVMDNLGTEKSYRELEGLGGRYANVSGLTDTRYRTQSWNFEQKNIAALQLLGRHLRKNEQLEIDWIVSTSVSNSNQPDLRYFSELYTVHNFTGEEQNHRIVEEAGGEPRRYYRRIQAFSGEGQLNFNRKYKNKALQNLRWGFRSTAKYQFFDERQIRYNTSYLPYTGGGAASYIQEANYINWSDTDDALIPGIFLENAYDSTNNYVALELLLGAYASSLWTLGPKTQLEAGFRVEGVINAYTGFDQDSISVDGFHMYPVLLPSVSLRHELDKNVLFRAAYSGTIARPSLRELSAFTSFDYMGDYKITGNLELAKRPTHLQHLDLRWERYEGQHSLLAGGFFAKYLINPIELATLEPGFRDEMQFRTAPWGYLLGMELELRQELGMLGKWGEAWQLQLNLSYVHARAKIGAAEYEFMHLEKDNPSKFRYLFGQSPYNMSVLLQYHNKKLNFEANVGLQVQGERLAYVLYGNTPDIIEQPRPNLDVHFNKPLGRHFQLRFSVQNLLDSPFLQTQTFKAREYAYREFRWGRSFNLGFYYNMNK